MIDVKDRKYLYTHQVWLKDDFDLDFEDSPFESSDLSDDSNWYKLEIWLKELNVEFTQRPTHAIHTSQYEIYVSFDGTEFYRIRL
jgi:hypothetical protein